MNFEKTNISQSPIELIPMGCANCDPGCGDLFGEHIDLENGANNTAGEQEDEAKLAS